MAISACARRHRASRSPPNTWFLCPCPSVPSVPLSPLSGSVHASLCVSSVPPLLSPALSISLCVFCPPISSLQLCPCLSLCYLSSSLLTLSLSLSLIFLGGGATRVDVASNQLYSMTITALPHCAHTQAASVMLHSLDKEIETVCHMATRCLVFCPDPATAAWCGQAYVLVLLVVGCACARLYVCWVMLFGSDAGTD